MSKLAASAWRSAVCALVFAIVTLDLPGTGVAAFQKATAVDSGDLLRAGTVSDFVRALARAEVAAGFVTSRADMRAVSEVARRKLTSPALSATVGEVVSAFRSRYPGYEVDPVPGGSLFFAPRATPCRAALRQPLEDLKLTGPVYAVGFHLLRSANPAIPNIPPGVVGSGPSLGEPSLILRQVSLFYQRLTLHEALDEIVRQVPGLVWLLVQDVDRRDARPSCLLHWMTGQETAATTYDFLQRRSR